MKKVRILVVLVLVAGATFYSCTDSNPLENEANASKSMALRTTLNEIKKAANISGKNAVAMQDQFFCFNFVYPITISYNNGTQVSVTNYEGLIDILTNENSTLYVDGIAFPFQVQEEGTITTIDNEAEFFALIQNCTTFHTINSFVFDFTCYSIIYPISVINANQETIIVNNQTELMQLVSLPVGAVATYQLNIVFPISISQNNQTVVIHNLYEFFELNNDCSVSDCNCPQNYAPICVQTATGVVEYANKCLANCDGYSAGDFVNCGNSTAFNFGELLNSCFYFHYPMQVEYQGAIVTVNSDSELLQYYFPSISQTPAFVFPVVIFWTNDPSNSTIVASQAIFDAAVTGHCN